MARPVGDYLASTGTGGRTGTQIKELNRYGHARRQELRNTNYTQVVTPRGSDRFPWQFYWDLALQADVTVFKEIGVGLKAEAFSLTDTQTQIGGSTSTNPAVYGRATSRCQFIRPRNVRLTALVTF